MRAVSAELHGGGGEGNDGAAWKRCKKKKKRRMRRESRSRRVKQITQRWRAHLFFHEEHTNMQQRHHNPIKTDRLRSPLNDVVLLLCFELIGVNPFFNSQPICRRRREETVSQSDQTEWALKMQNIQMFCTSSKKEWGEQPNADSSPPEKKTKARSFYLPGVRCKKKTPQC